MDVKASDAIHILIDSLEVSWIELLDSISLSWSLLDLVDDGLQYCISIVVKQSLKKFVLVVHVVYFYY